MEEEGRAVGLLPVDAWLHVFSFLPPRDLLTVGLVCSEWHSLSAHNHVWRVVNEAMQPSAFYSHYAAHLLAEANATVDDGQEAAAKETSSFKRAFLTRCERDLRWERKEYSTQRLHISLGEWDFSVRGVAISPTNKDVFSVAAYDGIARVFKNGKKLSSVAVPKKRDISANLNSTRWTCDGAKVAFGSHCKSLFVYDAETMHLHRSYQDAFFGGSDRAPLEAHPEDPNLLLGAGSNNATLTVFDLRSAEPVKQWNPHRGTVRDVCFVEGAGFGIKAKWAVASISESRTVHVSDFDAGVSRLSFQFNNELRQHGYYNGAYAVAMPPPYFGLSRHKADYDRNRFVLAGGVGSAASFSPDGTRQEMICIPGVDEHFWKMRYNSNGTLMFLATDNDTLELFRRNPDGTHSHLHTIVRHKDDIEDCDIALDDSYVVTASQDGTVAYITLNT